MGPSRLDHFYAGVPTRTPLTAVRQYGPYAAVAFCFVLLLWGTHGAQRDLYRPPLEPVAHRPRQRWEGVAAAPAADAPAPRGLPTCDTPAGTWYRTCSRRLLVEGPCAGRCRLTALCQDREGKFVNASLEYLAAAPMEAKNFDGHLCAVAPGDGSLSCGETVGPLPGCPDDEAPRRRETRPGGLWAPGDTGRSDLRDLEPGTVRAPRKGRAHKVPMEALRNPAQDVDDRTNSASCPIPAGNWAHTCQAAVVIEGPCAGQCLLKARCQTTDKALQATAYEYREHDAREIQNVNGLLCHVGDPDATPVCGVNFHRTLPKRHCPGGRVPVRYETLEGALPNPAVAAAPAVEAPLDEADGGERMPPPAFPPPRRSKTGARDDLTWDRPMRRRRRRRSDDGEAQDR